MAGNRAVLTLLVLGLCSHTSASPVKLILDTDIGGGGCRDVDDVGAICIANALADNGEAELLAVIQNTQPPQCTGAISVLNHYYGRDSVPIGAYKGTDLPMSDPLPYITELVQNFPAPIKNSSQVPPAVQVYRSVLAGQPDGSVAISSIGLLTNLRDLLKSPPDQYSTLNGAELISRKVKLLAVMGGNYPSSASEDNHRALDEKPPTTSKLKTETSVKDADKADEKQAPTLSQLIQKTLEAAFIEHQGRLVMAQITSALSGTPSAAFALWLAANHTRQFKEYDIDHENSLDRQEARQAVEEFVALVEKMPECNLSGGIGSDHRAGSVASAFVFSQWPRDVQIVFSGFSIGAQVVSGANMTKCDRVDDPCRAAYINFTGKPNAGRFSWDLLSTLVAVRGAGGASCEVGGVGYNTVNNTSGGNTWTTHPGSNQSYLTLKDAKSAANSLNKLLCQAPQVANTLDEHGDNTRDEDEDSDNSSMALFVVIGVNVFVVGLVALVVLYRRRNHVGDIVELDTLQPHEEVAPSYNSIEGSISICEQVDAILLSATDGSTESGSFISQS